MNFIIYYYHNNIKIYTYVYFNYTSNNSFQIEILNKEI